MGSLHLLSCLKMSHMIEVIGIADKSKQNRKRVSKYKIKTYDDYKDLIDGENLDCLIVSLPNFLKKECIDYASEKGIDVFMDKPIARNYVEAKEIAKKVERMNTRLMICSNYRYHPNIKKIRNLMEEGLIGNVHSATLELIMNGPFSHPLNPRPVADWYLDPVKSGGGALLDLGYHLIDLNVWFFGKCEILFSHIQHILNLPVEDASTLILRSKDSSVVSVLNSGWFSKIVFPSFNFRMNLHGSGGFLSSDQFSPKNMILHAIKEVIKNTIKKCIGKETDYLSYTYYYSSFYQILKDFFNDIIKGIPFSISIEEELEVMRIVDKIYSNNMNTKRLY